jgi:hypothetical protein
MRFQGADILGAEAVPAGYFVRNLSLVDTSRTRKTSKLDQEISKRQPDDRQEQKYQSKKSSDFSLFGGIDEFLHVHLFIGRRLQKCSALSAGGVACDG